MQKKFATAYNYGQMKRPPEENHFGPSQTIPDQSMSVAELFTRYTKGMPLGGNPKFVLEYDDENLPPDFDRMDLTEQQEFLLASRQELQDINERERERKKPKPKAEDSAPPPAKPGETAAQSTNTP